MMNKTKEVIAEMLKENTGSHFLDSGGTGGRNGYGRHHERNQARDFESEPATKLEFEVRAYSGKAHLEISVTHNTYHWLSERLEWSEEGNKALKACARFIRMADGEAPYDLELAREFPVFFGVWSARHDEADRDDCHDCGGWGFRQTETVFDAGHNTACSVCKGRGYYRTSNLVWSKGGFSSEVPDDYKVGGIYGDGEPVTVNTYNGEDLLDQTIQYTYFEMNGRSYVVLQIHGGCDVRGGYTGPQVFEVDSNLGELVIFDNAKASIACSGCESKQEEFPGVVKDDSGFSGDTHYWTTDDGCHWYGEGSCGYGAPRQLEKFEPVIIDEKKFNELTSKPLLLDGEPLNDLITTSQDEDGRVYVKGWVRGYLCIDEDTKEGLCPHCGGKLSAGSY